MKNIDRLARFVTKYGANSIIIHTIPKTNNWIVAQKLEPDKWLLTLCNPMGNVTYNLGTASEKNYIEIWTELVRLQVEEKIAQIERAKQMKNIINNFLKKYEKKTNRNKKHKKSKPLHL